MMVRIYPTGERAEFGATRFEVTWWELTASALKRARNADGNLEIDPDRDIIEHCRSYKTKDPAIALARRVAPSTLNPKSAYGCATVQMQRVDWFVEEDRIAEWSDVGEAISIPDDVPYAEGA